MRKRRGISTKALVALLALVLVIGCSLGGTLAWFVDEDEVVNTFTVGNINIQLEESPDLNLKIVPGVPITKDPEVTVLANSEACWLFVQLEEENWPVFNGDRKADYQFADGWIKLDDGVYYREVDAETAKTGATYGVLQNDVVTVSSTLTKDEIATVMANQPKLTITACAVQKEGVDTAPEAWAIANPANP